MTNNEERKNWIHQERLVESIAEIREMHDETCIDRVAVVHLRPNGEITFLDVHPEEFRDQIPSEVWHGRVVSLDFGIGAFPSAVADWLEEYIDEVETICAGLRVSYDQRGNEVGALSSPASEALQQLQEALSSLDDPILSKNRITRYAPEDFFADSESVIQQLKSAEEARQWATDAVNNGDPFSDANADTVILDVEESVFHVLQLWRDANQPPTVEIIDGSDW